jgi:hypothetical protein
MAGGGHRHPQKVCSTLWTGRPAPRAVATLNDRDVVDTVNSTTTVDGPLPLQTGHCRHLFAGPCGGDSVVPDRLEFLFFTEALELPTNQGPCTTLMASIGC